MGSVALLECIHSTKILDTSVVFPQGNLVQTPFRIPYLTSFRSKHSWSPFDLDPLSLPPVVKAPRCERETRSLLSVQLRTVATVETLRIVRTML